MLNAGLELRRPAESAPRLLGEALKRGSVLNRQVGENLAIQFDSCFLQAVDECVVAHPIQLGGGPDAYDPQRAKLPLALLAPAVGELQAALDGFFSRPVELGFCEEVTAGAV